MAYYNKNKNKHNGTGMTPEVIRIFDELEEYHDYCRFNLLKFDEADLFKSTSWQRFNENRKRKAAYDIREAKREAKRKAAIT